MIDLEEVFHRIKDIYNIKKDKDLSVILGVKQQTLTNWKLRNKIPYEEIISICLKENINLKYIITGIKEEEIEKKIDYEKEIIENIKKLNEKEKKYIYHLIESKIIKKEI